MAKKHFENKSYSSEINSLLIGISSSITDYVEKPKFIKKDGLLVFQVTIDYSYFKKLQTLEQNYECIAVCLLRDIQVLRNFNFKGFVVDELRNDFKIFFQNIGWLGEVINMI